MEPIEWSESDKLRLSDLCKSYAGLFVDQDDTFVPHIKPSDFLCLDPDTKKVKVDDRNVSEKTLSLANRVNTAVLGFMSAFLDLGKPVIIVTNNYQENDSVIFKVLGIHGIRDPINMHYVGLSILDDHLAAHRRIDTKNGTIEEPFRMADKISSMMVPSMKKFGPVGAKIQDFLYMDDRPESVEKFKRAGGKAINVDPVWLIQDPQCVKENFAVYENQIST